MDRFAAVLAPLAVLLLGGAVDQGDQVAPVAQIDAAAWDAGLFPAPVAPTATRQDDLPFPASDSFRAPVEHQVRIEQRITIRIAPRAPSPRPLMLDSPEVPQFLERDMGKCLPIAGIAGVQVGRGNRLMLFMRDQRMISLGLEKSCRPQDFYSGFYVERSPDGQICVDRDRLQSRSGANCALTRMSRLVER